MKNFIQKFLGDISQFFAAEPIEAKNTTFSEWAEACDKKSIDIHTEAYYVTDEPPNLYLIEVSVKYSAQLNEQKEEYETFYNVGNNDEFKLEKIEIPARKGSPAWPENIPVGEEAIDLFLTSYFMKKIHKSASDKGFKEIKIYKPKLSPILSNDTDDILAFDSVDNKEAFRKSLEYITQP